MTFAHNKKSNISLFKNCTNSKEIFIFLLNFYKEAVQRPPYKK
jgi:hypothetical protein